MAMSVVYANFAGEIVQETRNGVVSHLATDCQGSTIALMDDSGNVTDTYDYWSYGEERVHTGSSETRLTFLGALGYLKDILNKLYYIRARFYRPELGRWHTQDPWWPIQDAYLYVAERPVTLADPSGRATCKFDNCFKCAYGVATDIRVDVALADVNADNALRHCVWACKVVRVCGEKCIVAVLDKEVLHDMFHDLSDSVVDTKNDAVGYVIGKDSKLNQCAKACRLAKEMNMLER